MEFLLEKFKIKLKNTKLEKVYLQDFEQILI